MVSEKMLIWHEIKRAAPAIMKAGGNAVEILIWSQGRSLEEVRDLLRRDTSGQLVIIRKDSNRRKDVGYNVDKIEKKNSQVNFTKPDKKEEHKTSIDEKMKEIPNYEQTRKIRELVEYEESNLSENEKRVLGLVTDDN